MTPTAFCLQLSVKKILKKPIFVLGPTGTPVMWVIFLAILLCAQNSFDGKNRLENAKSKFHAQKWPAFTNFTTNESTNWAETLGNEISTAKYYDIKFTTHQEVNCTDPICPHRIELCTKNRKNCISISTDIDFNTRFFSLATGTNDELEKGK